MNWNTYLSICTIYVLFVYKETSYVKDRDCGGELSRLGRLTHLGEISLSLRNSYKNIKCSYEK